MPAEAAAPVPKISFTFPFESRNSDKKRAVILLLSVIIVSAFARQIELRDRSVRKQMILDCPSDRLL